MDNTQHSPVFARISMILTILVYTGIISTFFIKEGPKPIIISFPLAVVGIAFAIVSFTYEDNGRRIAWTSFLLNAAFLLGILCIYLYVTFAETNYYSRGDA